MGFGGAGPVHANRLASETQIPITVIPMSPGTTSAMGLLVTDLKHDYSTTMIAQVQTVNPSALDQTFSDLEAQGRSSLAREGVAEEHMRFVRQADVRYMGQSYELTIPLPNHELGTTEINQALENFHREHDRAYGYNAPQEPVELVNLRLSAIGQITKPHLRELDNKNNELSDAKKASRSVYFSESGGFVECPIYDRYQLSPGHNVEGPAVVEEIDSTTVVHPGYRALVDRFGNLLIGQSS